MTESGPRPPVISISVSAASAVSSRSRVSIPNRAAAARRSVPERRGGAALRHGIDADDPADAEVAGDPGRELPDGSQAEHGQGPVLRRVGVGHGLVGGRQHVGQEEVLLVRPVRRDLDRAELGLRHPQELGLAAGY